MAFVQTMPRFVSKAFSYTNTCIENALLIFAIVCVTVITNDIVVGPALSF